MARIQIPEGKGDETVRMWSLAPQLGAGVAALSDAVYARSQLPAREREAARMRIAQINDCHL